jgi:hypothetical protein
MEMVEFKAKKTLELPRSGEATPFFALKYTANLLGYQKLNYVFQRIPPSGQF